MRYSHSRVECYEQCPYKYHLRYTQKLKTLPTDDPASPLIVGTAMHEGIEKGVKEAIKNYYMSYPIITDAHVIEAIKIEKTVPKVRELIDSAFVEGKESKLIFEYEIKCNSFIGFIDLLIEVAPGYYIIVDFKYSNNVDHYLETRQLHVYKYYFELVTGHKVLELHYIMIPKVSIKQKKTETLKEFKQRLISELDKVDPYVEDVKYDTYKVLEHKQIIEDIENNYSNRRKPTNLCPRFCEYYNYCQSNGKIDFEIIYPEDNKNGN